jgi:hypothetical protein
MPIHLSEASPTPISQVAPIAVGCERSSFLFANAGRLSILHAINQ